MKIYGKTIRLNQLFFLAIYYDLLNIYQIPIVFLDHWG